MKDAEDFYIEKQDELAQEMFGKDYDKLPTKLQRLVDLAVEGLYEDYIASSIDAAVDRIKYQNVP